MGVRSPLQKSSQPWQCRSAGRRVVDGLVTHHLLQLAQGYNADRQHGKHGWQL